jgi:hypothetical protein
MTPPPYALPLRIRKAAESFAVEDANGVALAYVYFQEDPGRRARQSALGHRSQGGRADDRAAIIAKAESWPEEHALRL